MSKTLVLQFVKDCGLANQMFEYAAGLGIAKRLGIPMILNWKPTPKREFGLTHFGIPVPPFKEYPVVSCKLGQGNREIVEHALKAVQKSEHEFPAVSHPFQCESCFSEVAGEVRELFKLDPLPLDIPEGCTPVAVQVRRGDYVNHPRLDVVTPEYFKNAIGYMRGHVERPHFFVVSDDPAWCERLFARASDVTVMPPQSAIDGLRTMAACRAHVISNSTYGWWGAWLNESGPVVVPEIWHHKPGSYGKWKPAPDRWVKVPVGKPKSTASPLKHHPQEYDRAIVYPWHADLDRWHSLRYSLRSVEENFKDDCPILILGTRRPHWLTHGKHRIRFIECWGYPDALMLGTQIAGETLWMNDDILLLKPATWSDIVPLHFGPVSPDLVIDFMDRPNPWRTGFLSLMNRIKEAGVEEVLNYSTHTPYRYERQKALWTMEKFGVTGKMAFENAYFGFHGEGSRLMNGDRVELPPFGDARFLNHTDLRLSDELKLAIGDRFPEFAPWEIRAPLDQ